MSNYSAEIVKITNIRKHSNADRLNCTTVFGNNIIVGKDIRVGDMCVYFPLESQLSEEFCKANDLIRRYEVIDGQKVKKGGMFDDNRRVRAQKFRGEFSEGFVLGINSLSSFCDVSKLKEGDSFNKIKGVDICEKYVIKRRNPSGPLGKRARDVGLDRFVDGQFHFHSNTAHLGRSLREFNLDDVISISYKIHGSSFTARKILVNKGAWLWKKPVYELVASSRNCVKDMSCKDDIWVKTAKELEDAIPNGYTMYGEIAGFSDLGGQIQKGYDYGCEPKQKKTFVYRMTYTTPEGRVIELTYPQVKEFCDSMGLETPKLFYTGTVRDYCISRGIDVEDRDWRENWLEKLKEEYNEKDCFMCNNNVPEEGVVIRKDGIHFKAFKLKSSRFLLTETEILDKGEDIES